MQAGQFETWLRAKGLSSRTIDSRLSTCRRLEHHEGDLDEHFDSDGMSRLLAALAYSTDDERRGASPRHKIPIFGNVRNGTATLKNSATLYYDFRRSQDNGNELAELLRARSRQRRPQLRLVDQPTNANSPPAPQAPEEDLAAIIAGGESDRVEFKETLRFDVRQEKNNPEMGKVVVKTIAAFLNTHGGRLFVGVKDDGSILGLEADKFSNEDHAMKHLTDLVSDKIGSSAWKEAHASFKDIHGVRVLVVQCEKASLPAYVREKGPDREVFYIRTNVATKEISGRELVAYVNRQFPASNR